MAPPIKTFDTTVSYDALFEDIAHILVRVMARPLTAGLAAPLVAFQADLGATADQEKQLIVEEARTEYALIVSDVDVDGFVDSVVNTLLTITGGDRHNPLYVHYLGGQQPAVLKDPVLGPELETVRGWLLSLPTSPYPGLAALAPAGAQVVAAADKAQLDHATAFQALKDFRDVGGRKTLVDKANAIRLATYGALGDIANSHPEANLPRADTFFRHDRRRRTPLTSKELGVKIDAAKAALTALEAQQAQAKAHEDEAAADKAKKEADARAKAIAAAKKKLDDAAAKLDALQK